MDDALASDFPISTDDLLNDTDRSYLVIPFRLLQVELKRPILAYFSYYIQIIFGLDSVFYLYNMRGALKHVEKVYF